MNQINTIEEEVTTVASTNPEQVIKQTTRVVEPQAKGQTPQKVYDTKKTIIRFNQIIWFILGFVEVFLAFRIILKMLGANSGVGFTSLVYAITNPLVAPFVGILRTTTTGTSVFEWSTIIAGVVYLFIAWGLVYLMNLIYPITPKDVSTQ